MAWVLGVIGTTVGLFVGMQLMQCREPGAIDPTCIPPHDPEFALLAGAIGLGIGLLIAAVLHLIRRLRASSMESNPPSS